MKFDDLYLALLKEAEGDAPPIPREDEGGGSEEGDAPPAPGGEGEGLPDEVDLDALEEPLEEEPESNPEEIELAKVAVRALYFNLDAKDVHQYKLKIKDDVIPFEKIPDYFEETKQWKPVLAFIEHVMDKFEGTASRWAEEKEISGKPIVQKIKILNRNIPIDQQLDDAKRIYWVRIILNCILFGKATENINIGDVTDRNIKEVFNWLKLHYGVDTRGITPSKDYQSPGVF